MLQTKKNPTLLVLGIVQQNQNQWLNIYLYDRTKPKKFKLVV